MNIDNSLKKLFSLHSFGIKLGLDNINCFLNEIGKPYQKLKMFHVAGSNGKGSTSAFLASILIESNYKVGLYTSPHFVRFNERITINGKEIPDEFIASFIDRYENLIDQFNLTFFEVTTAIAFRYFETQKVDYAVIETGLGGRLDATNVIRPLASIITSISLEHTHILGNTIEQISAEKAGIIKKGIPVFIGKLPPQAVGVIENKCSGSDSELFKITEYLNEKKNSFELYTDELELDDWNMPLKGDYQKYNAALASLVISKTLDESDSNIFERGIKNVVKNTRIQGRYEFYNKRPDIIFDSAHNPEGFRNFLDEFKKDIMKYSKKIVLFGAMRDKAVENMLSMLNKYFDEIHITSINYDRACTITELIEIADKLNIKVLAEHDPVALVRNFSKEDKNNVLVVLGSMYVLGELKSRLEYK
ncbi:MAG: bifunctional folylpolyglutamate synthase/dihydrofolate synthase [Ignavibacteriaceae bacterium]|nr:bifunctional folylpolyglutamate synthase/dihydrofolate synthase [Ignavibacteriaceae bacterium]